MTVEVLEGDCIDVMAGMPPASVHAVVCDPPYGLSKPPDAAEVMRHWLAGDDYEHRGGGFMGSSWDSFVPGPAYWHAVYRVLKPGGFLLAFGGTRTVDLLTLAVRFAGFEIRDQLMWLYGSGFPKSRDIGKAIDARAGAEREVVSVERTAYKVDSAEARRAAFGAYANNIDEDGYRLDVQTAPATAEAAEWDGWGTALKPAYEPVIVARKPFRGTVEANVLEHGTGGLNIDGCRIPVEGGSPSVKRRESIARSGEYGPHGTGNSIVDRSSPETKSRPRAGEALGRWPANVMLSHHPDCRPVGTTEVNGTGHWPSGRGEGGLGTAGHDGQDGLDERHARGETVEAWECVDGCPVAALDDQAGELRSGANPTSRGSDKFRTAYGDFKGEATADPARGADAGAASRFFHVTGWECHPECPVALLDGQSGDLHLAGNKEVSEPTREGARSQVPNASKGPTSIYGDPGGASRFLYVAKASDAERNAGLAGMEERLVYGERWESLNNPRCLNCDRERIPRATGDQPCECEQPRWAEAADRAKANYHPTVKPIDVMRWLVRLVTPAGGVVLDPFAGSGTTLCAAAVEGFDAIGIEQEPDFAAIARVRADWWAQQPEGIDTGRAVEGDRRRRTVEASGQAGLF